VPRNTQESRAKRRECRQQDQAEDHLFPHRRNKGDGEPAPHRQSACSLHAPRWRERPAR
jgi:hypothetical protein